MPNTEINYTIDFLLTKILSGDKQYDITKIVEAYKFAESHHIGQKRDSGEPYITHPLAVAYILIELGMDTDTICVALLHDVVEDTDATLDEVRKLFGDDCAMLVDGVTKIGKIPLFTKEEQQAENVRKILLAMSQDIRVIIVKLADRLHNMRTLYHRPAEKQRATALETMNIYAPIAHRLGIRAIKEELEDISFRYLDPFAYTEIEQVMEKRINDRQSFIGQIQARIKTRLESMDFVKKPQIDGRVKSIYGIYKKVYMTQRGFDEIYDKYAVRIIVSTVYECYSILGVIHDMFKPIPNRFKDYISTPKANMYQSLHTTVIGREGIPFEVQIRTWEMHHTAEYGIAAHWKYKEGIHGKDRFEGKLAWIRQIIEAQQETNDVEEIVRTIKSDLAPEDVFAFTPKGDMITLPVDSTVIDFAYAIHTQVGHKMMSAKVDGKIVSLDYRIKTGEIVEIILTKDANKGPNRSWLDIAKTNEAKAKIRSWFKKECREENIRNGKDELEREFRRNLIRVPEEDLDEFLSDDLRRHNCETVEDFYAAIGYGGILLSKLIQRYKDKYTKQYLETEKAEEQPTLPTTPNRKKTDGITVEGMENCLIKFAKCCNPLPGDDVVGFITRGHGVSIHKADCVNYVSAMEEEKEVERWVKASWEETHTKSYRTTIDIISYDRPGLLADVANLLSEMRIFIHESVSRGLKDGYASITVTISVGGIEQLNNVVMRLKRIPGVSSVERTGK